MEFETIQCGWTTPIFFLEEGAEDGLFSWVHKLQPSAKWGLCTDDGPIHFSCSIYLN